MRSRMSWMEHNVQENMKTVRDPPDPATTFWRYTSLEALETLLTSHRLWFHQFKELQRSDEQEGMVTEGFWESVSEFLRREDPSKGPDDLREWAERQLDRL